MMEAENSNRTRIIGLRLTPEEYAKIERKWKASTCRKLSNYVRKHLFDKSIVTTKVRVKNAIDIALLRERTMSINELAKLLEKEGIHAVLRKSAEGVLYGITYVDHKTKSVFNGSSLGKEYSAKAIQERCGLKVARAEKNNKMSKKLPSKGLLINNMQQQKDTLTIPDFVKLLDVLMQAEYSTNYLPNQLKNKRRKKKRKGLSDN